jgi:hypothetical protein
MKTLRIVLITILVSCFLQTYATAQQEKPAAATPTRLALEVTYWKGDKPAFQTVPSNSWYARFRRIGGWKPAEDGLPVLAVNIAPGMEGAAVRLVVSVHVGRKHFERQDTVGSYLLQENERLVVYDMTAFGLEPFEVTVVRVEAKGALLLPAVTSNAPSVQVKNIEAVDSTFPMFKLTLKNISEKNVIALYVETFAQGRLRSSGMPRNRDGEPLIRGGTTYEFKRELNKDARPSGGGFAPEPAPNQAVLIKTAIFDDGTYEGDATMAAQYKAFAYGERTQLQRLIARYREALESTDQDAQTLLENLRRQVNALDVEAELPVLDKLLTEYGAADASILKSSIELTMFGMKKDRLKEIDDFGKKQGAAGDREAARAWLAQNLERLQKWHDRLKKL